MARQISAKETSPNITLILLGVLVVFVVGVTLHLLRTVLLPFVIAILLSNIFEPVVMWLKKKSIPTAVSLIIVLLTFALVLFLFSLVIYTSADAFVQQLPKYQQRLTGLINSAASTFERWAQIYELRVKHIDWGSMIQFSSVTTALTSGVGSFIDFVTYIVIILLFMLFILAGSGELITKIQKAFPARQARRIGTILLNIETRVRQYLLTKTLISAATGFLTFLILLILGVDFPLIWGILTFLLNFIPNIGSIIAVIFPFLLSLLQFETSTTPILVALLLGTTQLVMGNVVEPRLMAFRLDLSPLFVLVSLIFWGWLWGVWGMILAVPIMASVKIVLENIEPLRPLALLMGRLTSIESS